MKKWQEIEFLDFKERQIRRRTQKSRQVKIQLEENAPSSGLRFVAVTALMAVVLGVGGFLYYQHQQELRAADLARRTELIVTEVKGDVEYSTATTPFARLKADTRMSETFTVKQGAGARCTVATSLAQSRLVVLDRAQVEIQKPAATSHDPAAPLFVTAVVKQGTLMCDFKQGDPKVEVKLPQSVVLRGQTGFYKVVVEDQRTTVLVRESRVKLSRTDGKKEGLVRLDERAIINAAGEWGKPEKFTTPETVWK